MYTVKQLSDLAGVTVRTLHYYDEIDLLKPSKISENGYRHYDDEALIRLQQILFYREMGLELLAIKEILDRSDFDLMTALRSHRSVLQEKINRLQNLVHTVDETMKHITGEKHMAKRQMFEAFTEEEQEYYTRVARLEYGPDLVNESVNRWNSYSKAKQDAILEESGQIYVDIAEAIDAGKAPQDEDVQAILVRWQENLRYFYEPTRDIMRGLVKEFLGS